MRITIAQIHTSKIVLYRNASPIIVKPLRNSHISLIKYIIYELPKDAHI